MEGLGNLPTVIDIVREHDPDIICLQETLLRSYNNVKIAEPMRTHQWIFKNTDTTEHIEDQISKRNLSYHGVAIGVKKSISENLREISIPYKNALAVMIPTGDQQTVVINTYLPTYGKDRLFSEALDTVTAVLQDLDQEARTMMIGDMNVDTDSDPRRVAMWMEFLSDNNMEGGATGTPTHRHKVTGNLNELDRTVTRNMEATVRVIENPLNSSDHFPILAETRVGFKRKKTQVKGAKIESKVNIRKLDENIDEFRRILDDLATDMEAIRHDYPLDSQNGIVSNLIFRAALEATGQDLYQSQAGRRPRRYKVDKELYKAVRQAKRRLMKESHPERKKELRRELKTARKFLRRELNKRIELTDLQTHREITEAANSQSNKIFRVLRKVKQEGLVENKLPSKIEGYGLKYEAPNVLEGLREIFRLQTTIDHQPRYDEKSYEIAELAVKLRMEYDWPEEEYQAIEMDLNQYKKIVGKMKPEKAQDYLGLSNDLLKRIPESMMNLLHNLAVDCLQARDYGGLIRNFGKGTIIVKKPGKPITEAKNWRKIVVNTTILNVIQLYVQPKIEEKVRMIQRPAQLGFTAGVPITNAVVGRQELQQLSKYMKRTLFFGVLDLMSCFPRISREQVLLLASSILTPAEWELLAQIYHDTWGDIRVEGQKSRLTASNIGSIEGGILSVQILKIFMSTLLLMLERSGFTAGVDFQLHKISSGALGVADDVLLFTWSASILREMLRICQAWSDTYRGTFSADKSVIVIQRTKGDTEDYGDFHLNGEVLKVVDTAEHLGVPILSSGDNSDDLLLTRLTKGRRAMQAGLSMFNPRSYINIATKIELWRKKYRAVVLYGLDTTSLTASKMKQLETFQITALRGMLGLSERASRVKVRLLAGVPTMSFEVWKARFGDLNSILTGSTVVRALCVLAWECRVTKSWTVETVQKLHNILTDEGLDDKVKAVDFLAGERNQYKEGMKNLMTGAEIRNITRELKNMTCYRVPTQPFRSPLTLVNSDFSAYGKELVKSYAQVYCSDFYRNFSKKCYLCLNKQVPVGEEHRYIDDAQHLLSNRCQVAECTRSTATMAEIKLRIAEIKPDHLLTSEVASEDFTVRFLLNPSCITMGANAIAPGDIQSKGLDIQIRKFFHQRLKKRYELLRDYGFITKRKFKFIRE